nr:probable carbohydrate esterase At4g34215 [Ipomoea batatas]
MASLGGVGYDLKGKKVWDENTPPACQPSGRSIFRFNSKYSWEVAVEPLHRNIDTGNVCGVGPGMPFAHELLMRAPSLGVIGMGRRMRGETKLDDMDSWRERQREGGIAKKSEKDELGAKDYEGRSTGQTEAERMLRVRDC